MRARAGRDEIPVQRAEPALAVPAGQTLERSQEKLTCSSTRVRPAARQIGVVEVLGLQPRLPPEAAVANMLVSKISLDGTSPGPGHGCATAR